MEGVRQRGGSAVIYTCYFSGLGDRSGDAVSVCFQQPPKFRLPVAEELAPPFGMYWKFLRGRMSAKRFSQIYSIRFGMLDPAEIARKYDGKILVAWEGYDDKKNKILQFSHRHLIAEWLRSNGFQCEELAPMPRRRKIL
jgi:hypothetical protein